MSNRYCSYSYATVDGVTLTAAMWNGAFAAMLAGFDAVQADVDGDKTNQVRYSGLTANLPLAGYRITDAPSVPQSSSELVSKAYVDSLAISGLGPTQAGHAGGLVTTNGTTASWSDTQGITIQTIQFAQAMAALAYLNQ